MDVFEDLAAKQMDSEFAVFREMQDPWFCALDTLRMRRCNWGREPSDDRNEGRFQGAGPENKSSSNWLASRLSQIHFYK
jgi:hypothetical protein